MIEQCDDDRVVAEVPVGFGQLDIGLDHARLQPRGLFEEGDGENVLLGLEEQDAHVEIGDRIARREFDRVSQPLERILEAAPLLMQEAAQHMQTGAVLDLADAAVEFGDARARRRRFR